MQLYNGEPDGSYNHAKHGSIVETPDELKRHEKWDRRFLAMAALVSSWSKDPSTKCGAIIVRPDRSVCSVGFNGFPRGVEDKEEHLNDRAEKYERIIHAEVNAILAAKEPLAGYTMYTYPSGPGPSCARCATCIIQSGITRIVHISKPFGTDKPLEGWRAGIAKGLDMYRQADVTVVCYDE